MGTSKRLARALGHPVAIVDINDLGAQHPGASPSRQPTLDQLAKILGDKPPWASPASVPPWASSARRKFKRTAGPPQ